MGLNAKLNVEITYTVGFLFSAGSTFICKVWILQIVTVLPEPCSYPHRLLWRSGEFSVPPLSWSSPVLHPNHSSCPLATQPYTIPSTTHWQVLSFTFNFSSCCSVIAGAPWCGWYGWHFAPHLRHLTAQLPTSNLYAYGYRKHKRLPSDALLFSIYICIILLNKFIHFSRHCGKSLFWGKESKTFCPHHTGPDRVHFFFFLCLGNIMLRSLVLKVLSLAFSRYLLRGPSGFSLQRLQLRRSGQLFDLSQTSALLHVFPIPCWRWVLLTSSASPNEFKCCSLTLSGE